MKPTITLAGAALLACALAATLAGTPAAAQSPALGRLFSTPEERAALDSRREGATPDAAAQLQQQQQQQQQDPAAAAAAAQAALPPPQLVLNGIVRRSDGHSTVWINDEPRAAPNSTLSHAAVTVRLSSGRRVILKPGQAYDLNGGGVHDADQ